MLRSHARIRIALVSREINRADDRLRQIQRTLARFNENPVIVIFS